MAKKLVSYCSDFVSSAPDRIQNCECRFDVTYVSGVDISYVGRVSSVFALMRALRRRLYSDGSIFDVCVYLPSGRLVCEVGWLYRA